MQEIAPRNLYGEVPLNYEAPRPMVPESLAEIYAEQYALAERKGEQADLMRQKYLIMQGQEPQMRKTLAAKTAADSFRDRQAVLDQLLVEGDVDLAEQVLRLKESIPLPLVTETLAVEEAAATRFADPDQLQYEAGKPADILSQENELQAKGLAVMNTVAEMVSKLPMDFDIESTAGMSEPEIIARSILKRLKEGGKYADDIVRMIVPFLYPAERASAGRITDMSTALQMTLPGTADEREAANIWNQDAAAFSVSLETLKNRLGEQFKSAPLLAYVALLDSLFVGQKDNPQVQRLLAMSKLGDMENPLKNVYEYDTLGTIFSDPYVLNAFNLFDVAGAVAALPAAKRAVQVFFGNKALAASTANDALKATMDVNGNPAVRHVVGIARTVEDVIPELQKGIDEAYDTIDRGLAAMVDPQRINVKADQVEAVATADAKDLFGKRFISLVHAPSGPNHYVDVFLGNTKQAAYATEKGALKAAEAFGPEASVVKNPSGDGFLIKITRSVDESGFYTGAENVAAEKNITRFTPSKYLFSPAITSIRRSIEAGISSSLERAKIAATVDKVLEPISKLKTKQSKALGEVINYGKQLPTPGAEPGTYGKWFNYNELDAAYRTMHGRGITMEEAKAYNAYRIASDYAWTLMNKAEYDRLSAAGMETWRLKAFPMPTAIAKQVDNIAGISPESRILVEDGSVVPRGMVEDLLKDGKHIVLRVDGAVEHNRQEITHLIVRKSDATTAGLQKEVVAYTQGGTRNYSGNWFVKSARTGQFNDSEYQKSPYVHGVFETEGAARKYAKEMNSVSKIYKEYLEEAQKIHRGHKSTKTVARTLDELRALTSNRMAESRANMSLDAFEELIEKGFDYKKEIHALFDRDRIPGQLGPQFEHLQSYQHGGRLYYGQRGDFLKDGEGEFAPLTNPFAALSKQMGRMAQTAAMNNFAIREMGEWRAAYGHLYRMKSTDNVMFPTARDLVLYGEWAGESTIDANHIRNIAEAQRMYIKRLLGTPTQSDIYIAQSKARVGQSLSRMWEKDSKVAKGLAKMFGEEAVVSGKIVTESQVVSAMRGVMYNLSLGFFHVGQLVIQGSAALTASMMHPIHGMQAALDYFPIRMAMALKGNKKVNAYLDAALAKRGLDIPGGLTDLLIDYQRTGIHEIGKTDPLRDFSDVESTTKLNRAITQTGDILRMPLYEGERIGRIVAFGIARRQALEEVSKGLFTKGSDEYIRYIQAMTNKYTLNMMSGMETWWQKNTFTAIPTQFWQYPWKYAEIFLGLNKQFTSREKWMFIGGHTMAWGAFGVPGGPDFMELAAKVTDIKEETYYNMLYGLGDYALNALLTEDDKAAFSPQFGSGEFLGGLINDLFSQGTPLSAAGGITYDVLFKMKGTMQYLGRLWWGVLTAETVLRSDELVEASHQTLLEFAKYARSMSNATRAYYIHKYGMIQDARGNPVDRQTDFPEWIAAMGFRSLSEYQTWDAVESKLARDKRITEISNHASKLMVQANLAWKDGDQKKFETIMRVLRHYTGTLDNMEQQEVYSRAFKTAARDVDNLKARSAMEGTLRYERESTDTTGEQ